MQKRRGEGKGGEGREGKEFASPSEFHLVKFKDNFIFLGEQTFFYSMCVFAPSHKHYTIKYLTPKTIAFVSVLEDYARYPWQLTSSMQISSCFVSFNWKAF